jgi:hypothetical protein
MRSTLFICSFSHHPVIYCPLGPNMKNAKYIKMKLTLKREVLYELCHIVFSRSY